MRIMNLMENTKGREGCVFAHGLSFYVETAKHRLLLDLGPSEETLTNAQRLGVDLSLVDTVILSHGHYDHSGGLLAFAEKNAKAVIYMQESATGEFFADDGAEVCRQYRYIGIDQRIKELSQVRRLRGDFTIDEELEVFTIRSGVKGIGCRTKHSSHKLCFASTNDAYHSSWLESLVRQLPFYGIMGEGGMDK